MKKFRWDESFSKKQKAGLFLSLLLTYFPIICLVNWIMGNEIDGLSNFVQSILFALFMTISLPWSAKFFSKKIEKTIKTTLKKDEEAIVDIPSGQKIGLIVYGGKLLLTDERLLFVRHGFFQKTRMWALQRENIDHIKPKKIFLIADNGIEITDRYGKTYSFNMQKRDEILIALKKQLGLSLE